MSLPLTLGSDAQFARARDFLTSHGFADGKLCPALGMRDMSDLGSVRWDELMTDKLPAGLGWCLQVFVRGVAVPDAECRAHCDEEAFSAFISLGLLRPAENVPGALLCPVWLYPVDGFLIASDRRDLPEYSSSQPAEDVVFPAIYAGTLRFLALLPGTKSGDALDLCGG